MSRVAVLVDAGYLFKSSGRLLAPELEIRRERMILDTSNAMKVLTETGRSIAASDLLRVYWYDAAIENSRSAHREIAQQPYLKLRLGHLNSAGEQKGVDPLIIMDMITLSQNRACEEIVLLSGDADLIVGVLQAQERGVRVHLLGIAPSRANQSLLLREESDTCSEWGKDVISGFLRIATGEEMESRRSRRMRADASRDQAPTAVETSPGENLSEPESPLSQPTSLAQVVTVAKPSVDVTLLATVIDAVIPQIAESSKTTIRAAARPGIIPGEVDHMLLGTAKMILNTYLSEPEKRLLRRMLYDKCRENTPY